MKTRSGLALPMLGALAMSVGWGYRGEYGHESGAMIPGALMGLAVALAGGRSDWVDRSSMLGLLGAIGWAFGGQMSYGLLIGYTASGRLADVAFGFCGIFLVGSLWGAIGCGVLAMGVTESRARLERFAVPLVVLYLAWWGLTLSGVGGWLQERWPVGDSDWLAASVALAVGGVGWLVYPRCRDACSVIGLLAAGWWVGYGVLVMGLGLKLNPPRSENWAGCVGIAIALAGLHLRGKNRVALWLMGFGLISGGAGFVLGDLANMLGRAEWGPIGRSVTLRELNSWKWMEQGFGFLMGGLVGLVFAGVARAPVDAPEEDQERGPWGLLAPLFLLIPLFWENFWKNGRDWIKKGVLRDGLFGIDPAWWMVAVGVSLSAVVALAVLRARRGEFPMVPASAFGRAQLLFLCLLWAPAVATLMNVLPDLGSRGALFVHISFWLTAALASLIVVLLPTPPASGRSSSGLPFDDAAWRPGIPLLGWIGVGLLLVGGSTWATMEAHSGPIKNHRYRFGEPPSAQSKEIPGS